MKSYIIITTFKVQAENRCPVAQFTNRQKHLDQMTLKHLFETFNPFSIGLDLIQETHHAAE